MKKVLFAICFNLLIFSSVAFAQTSWLDRPLRNWNTSSNVPNAPRAVGEDPSRSNCRTTVRTPDSIADRAVTRAGWSLFGAAQVYGAVTLINAMASVDGMCRPIQYNTFVFVRNRFAGTLSPDTMDSRTDGALTDADLTDESSIMAKFARYTSRDALCCPSQTSTVTYRISGSRVLAQDVETGLSCQEKGGVEEPVERNIVTGTIDYLEDSNARIPQNAVLNVRLVDLTDRSSRPITEQRINLRNQRPPISFQLRFNENDIRFRNNYAVEAEITNLRGTVLYKNDVETRVLTNGNPNKVQIVLIPVGGIGGGVNDGILRGSVDYRQRIALPPDAEIRVKLVDISSAESADGTVIAEDKFLSNGRQVPIPFELRYNQNQIRSNRLYAVEAEIYTRGRLAFKNDREYLVITQRNPTSNIRIMMVGASGDVEERDVVTDIELNISKIGAGTLDIEGRSAKILIRARVIVQKNGNAEVTLSPPFGSSTTFSGNLIFADSNTLRIKVTNSGNADASGEIEVNYSGNRLNSVGSKDLILDSQKASINF